jgi:ABC-type multidrug transport system permease subunit
MKKQSLITKCLTIGKACFPATWSTLLLVGILGALFVGLGLALWQGDFGSASLAAAAIICTLLPFIVNAETSIYIPRSFSIASVIFVFATLYLGQVANYYQKYWWWDVALHSASAFTFGLIGLVVLVVLFSRKQLQATPLLFAFLVLSFSLAIGMFWEIFEFSGDQLFHTVMQHADTTGVVDTMKDEIMDAIGASVAAVVGYFYVQRGKKTPLDAFLDKTVRRNKK